VYYDIDDARLTKWYVLAVKRHLSSVGSLHRSISTNTPAPLRCLLLCPHQKRASGKARCDIVHCVTLWCTRRCLIRTHPQPEYQIGPQCRRMASTEIWSTAVVDKWRRNSMRAFCIFPTPTCLPCFVYLVICICIQTEF
jgi:hypothetical protein